MNWIRGLQVNYSKLKSLFLKYVPAIEKHERFVKISGDVRKRLNAVAQFKAEQNRQYWKKVGLERRRREPAVSSDLQLAHYIAKHCEQHAREFLASANTIRQRLPELGLSAREWRKRRKVVNTSRTKTRAKK